MNLSSVKYQLSKIQNIMQLEKTFYYIQSEKKNLWNKIAETNYKHIGRQLKPKGGVLAPRLHPHLSASPRYIRNPLLFLSNYIHFR